MQCNSSAFGVPVCRRTRVSEVVCVCLPVFVCIHYVFIVCVCVCVRCVYSSCMSVCVRFHCAFPHLCACQIKQCLFKFTCILPAVIETQITKKDNKILHHSQHRFDHRYGKPQIVLRTNATEKQKRKEQEELPQEISNNFIFLFAASHKG